MKQYKKYNVFISGNQPTDEEIYEAADKILGENPYHLKLISAEHQLEIEKQTLPLAEELKYERYIEWQLGLIENTEIGKLLLDSLSSRFRVFIVNKREDYYDDCGCIAATIGPLANEDGGHIRVYYTPDFLLKEMSGSDDILAHELFHAYRRGLKTIDYRRPDFMSAEEMYAVMMQNIYRSCRGHVNFCKNDKNTNFAYEKDLLDKYLSTSPLALYYLAYYLHNDKLARTIANWHYPVFNPWRDYVVYRKKLDDIQSKLPKSRHTDFTKYIEL